MFEIFGYRLEHAFVLLFIGLFIFCHFACRIRVKSLFYAHLKIFSESAAYKSSLLTFLKFTAIVTLFIAMAAPYTSRHIDITPKQGYDIALMLDASESMLQRGFDTTQYRLDRFDVVKNVVSDFIKTRTNDNLGVVVFGAFAFIAAPLTYDKAILSDIVKRLRVGIAGRSTAIYDALGQGINLLRKSEAKSKIAILLTDGHNTAFNVALEDVLALAKKYEIRVYTIGIGHEQEFNQILLNKIASDTGGKMFKAQSGEQLTQVYREIDRLEKSQIKSKSFEERTYYYHYPLLLSVLSLLLFVVLRHQKGLL